MSVSLRRLRLKAVWLLVIPFLWWATPTPATLSVGAGFAALGLLIRALSAGHIHKDRTLTTSGPYARTRNPLYLGSLLLGVGVAVAGGRAVFLFAFVGFFAVIYGLTMRSEARLLEKEYGERYRRYARRVPLLWPRLTRYHDREADTPRRFSLERYRRNREYQALLGVLAGFGFLMLRMYLP
jgi:protein-S-isoprenylcysteine O-methyltransferase Ste14